MLLCQKTEDQVKKTDRNYQRCKAWLYETSALASAPRSWRRITGEVLKVLQEAEEIHVLEDYVIGEDGFLFRCKLNHIREKVRFCLVGPPKSMTVQKCKMLCCL